jgi:hypothetical protein
MALKLFHNSTYLKIVACAKVIMVIGMTSWGLMNITVTETKSVLLNLQCVTEHFCTEIIFIHIVGTLKPGDYYL